jgi:hypothetical protein
MMSLLREQNALLAGQQKFLEAIAGIAEKSPVATTATDLAKRLAEDDKNFSKILNLLTLSGLANSPEGFRSLAARYRFAQLLEKGNQTSPDDQKGNPADKKEENK